MELAYLDPETGLTGMLRFSSGGGGYTTRPDDDPPNAWYEPRIKVPNNWNAAVFKDGLTGGGADCGYGTAQIIALSPDGQEDGFLDRYMRMAFDGQPLRLLYGDNEAPYSDFAVILTGTQAQPEFTWNYMNVKVRDYGKFFDRALSQYTYFGNNVEGRGIEGTPDDLMGKTKPLCFGRCLNVTPSCVSTYYMLFQVHAGPDGRGGPIKAVDAVYVDAALWPQDVSAGGTTESAACTYVNATVFTVAGDKRAAYVSGLRLILGQGAAMGNADVVSATYAGGVTTVTVAPVSLYPGLTSADITLVGYGGGDSPSIAALAAVSPRAGTYLTCLAAGIFMMSGSVSSGITCDVRGCALGGAYVDTVPGIIRRIVEHYIRRKRTNLIGWSEDFSKPVWTVSGLTKGAKITSGQFAGMTPLTETSETGSHVFSQLLDLSTGMFCFSLPVAPAGRTMARLMLRNPSTLANNCLADFDLTTGEVVLLQANGHAVGPQYTATGFITDGGVIVDASGALRLWVAGQPDEAFSQIEACLFFLSGTVDSYTDSFAGSGGVAGYVGAPKLGAQIEAYSSPSRYTGPTTTTPVSGYDPEVGLAVHSASFDALAALGGSATAEVGYALNAGDTTTAGDTMSALAATSGCWWAFDRDGLMRIGQLAKPSPGVTPVATFAVNDPAEPCRIITVDRSAPYDASGGAMAYRIIMQCVRNWTTQQKSAVATSLWTDDPTRVAWVGKQWREIRTEDLAILSAHPLACELSFAGYFAKFSDALAECRRLLGFYGQHLDKFTIKGSGVAAVKRINIGDIIRLKLPRLLLDNGRNCVVVGITETHENGEVSLGVIG